MVSTRRCAGALAAGLAVISLVSCEKKQVSPEEGPQSFIQSAIYVQGGLEQLKKASSFSAAYDATVGGIKIRAGKVHHRSGATRIEYTAPTRDAVVQVAAETGCWQSIGLAVVPCLEPLRAHTARLSQLLEASWLWPLVTRKDRQIRMDRVPAVAGGGGAAGKEQVKLTITSGGESIGTLLMDGETNQVVGLEMQTTLGGKTGAFVATFGKFEKACGTTIATERSYTLLGQPFATEKLGGVICEKVDDKLFVQPEQVKHGTVEPKVQASVGLICTKLKGALSGVDAALGTVMEEVTKKGFAIAGAAVLIHRKGPPQVKRPEQYVTDVCVQIDSQVWLTLKPAEWKGTFFLGELADQRVIAAYGIGDLDKTTAELPPLIAEAAKKRATSAGAPVYQFIYTRAADFPAEKRVSEMQIPIVE